MNININEEFSEEIQIENIDQFLDYCTIYDPNILPGTKRTIEINFYTEINLHRQKTTNNFILKYIKTGDPDNYYDGDYNDELSIRNIKRLYVCSSPYYFNLSFRAKEHLLNQIISNRDSLFYNLQLKRQLISNASYMEKIYTYYEYGINKKKWLVLLLPKKLDSISILDFDAIPSGFGETLLEADFNFQQARMRSFRENSQNIAELVRANIPLTKEKILEVCSRYDREINLSSLSFSFQERGFSFFESSNFTLSCSSEKRKFILCVNLQNSSVPETTWRVEKFLSTDPSGEPLNVTVSIPGFGESLEEAFQRSEQSYQDTISDPSELERLEREQSKKERDEDMRHEAREEQEHLDWLLSEGGEDAFPD
ncbi:hypothetical protein ACSQ6I_08005 [Anabaena sp. WFMT]|uniref:hypothetical protein n=1 Tax=Anabaena sp. WFMT TaxID=3449730 RepID=UPI003F223E1D